MKRNVLTDYRFCRPLHLRAYIRIMYRLKSHLLFARIISLISISSICFSMVSCGAKLQFSKSPSPHVPLEANFKNKKLALVLGGGGAKGFAHVGVIEELNSAGIVPDVIIGCSAGSIIGALYAANPNVEDLKRLVLFGKTSDVIALSSSDWPYGLYDKQQLARYLKNNINTKNFENLKIPFIATATNLEFGNLTAFSSGDIIQPILASAAYPGAYAPVEINGQYFVDCGVTDPVPVRLAKSLGFETIIAVNIAEQLTESSPSHAIGVIKRSMEIAYINQSKYSVEGADVIIDFNFKDIGIFTDKYNNYLYEEGKKSAKLAIPKILLKLKNKTSYP